MKIGSPAYIVAPRALLLTHEISEFLGARPSKMKRDIAVTQAVHLFDHTPPQIRRRFTDRAVELLSAAGHIREMRLLAHHTTTPWRGAAMVDGRSSASASAGVSEARSGEEDEGAAVSKAVVVR